MAETDDIASKDFEKFLREGFVLIKGSELIQHALREAFGAGTAFFQTSLKQKMQSRLPEDSGYRPYGVEYSQSPARPDEVESFTASYRNQPSDFSSLSNEGKHLHDRMLALFDLLEPLAERFIIELAERMSSTLQKDRFFGAIHASSILQLNYSRPAETNTSYLNELHEDGCLLTISSVTGPGFELKASDGSFLPLTPSGNELLFLSGEILWLLSGGIVRPVHHRVLPISSCVERMSLLFFVDLHPKSCIPWIKNEINNGVDIAERVLKNSTRFGLDEWKLDAADK
jgi:isopenicillin N synthase-like dioxygenase